jgi:hypothetical protein
MARRTGKLRAFALTIGTLPSQVTGLRSRDPWGLGGFYKWVFSALRQKWTENSPGSILAGGDRSRRATEKVIAKNQAGIPTLLEDGENIQAITHASGINELLVVTDRRLLRVKKGRMSWAPIALSDVAETRLGSRDLGRGDVKYMVIVDTHASKQYAEGDRRRFDPEYFFSIDFDDPGDARALCAIIDGLIESRD